jgi:hypothetical protein
MKKIRLNWVEILGITLAALLLIVGMVFLVAFFGNPVSKALATHTAKSHLSENYPSYTLERVGYNFKDGNYHAHLTDPAQVDGDFSVILTPGGKLLSDTYQDRVLSGENTSYRLGMEYRNMVAAVLETPQAGLPLDFGFGDLEIWYRESLNNHDCPDYALVTEDLVPNGVYDVRELGAQAGHLIYYLQVESPSPEALAHWLLEIRRLMDQAGVPFVSIDVDLRYLRNEDGTRPATEICVQNFPYTEIYAEGMTDRVTAAINAFRHDYNNIKR